jgi:ATP-dependent Clp endopeptidase proteolytic subunit ClpP
VPNTTPKKSLSHILSRFQKNSELEKNTEPVDYPPEEKVATSTNQGDDLPDNLLQSSDQNAVQLEEQGVFFIQGEISRDTVTPVIAALLRKDLDPSFIGDIIIFINSEGGILADTWALIDVMESTRIPITTIGMGTVCSAGTLILGAGDPSCRYVMPRTEIMSHTLSTGLFGNLHSLKAKMHGINTEHRRIVKFWTTHSKYKTSKEVEEHLLRPTDIYMTPKQALRHRIIDDIIVNQRTVKVRSLAQGKKKLQKLIEKQEKLRGKK